MTMLILWFSLFVTQLLVSVQPQTSGFGPQTPLPPDPYSPGEFSNWTIGQCSVSCGIGVRTDTRTCSSPFGYCYGNSIRAIPCFQGPCSNSDTCVIGGRSYPLQSIFTPPDDSIETSCEEPAICAIANWMNTTLQEVGDVAFLPSCSMRQALTRGFGCLNNFFGGVPYFDKGNCKSSVDEVVDCIGSLGVECFADSDNNCPSIVNFFPEGNVIIEDILRVAANITSLTRFLNLLRAPGEFIDGIYDSICPIPGNPPPFFVQQFLSLNLSFPFSNPICDDDVVDDLIAHAKDFITNYYSLRSHQRFCSLYPTLLSNITSIYQDRCPNIESFLTALFPSDYQYFVPVIASAAEVVFEILNNPRIPDCEISAFSDEAILTCQVGKREFALDRVSYYDDLNDVTEVECPPGNLCGISRWDDPSSQRYVEEGFCLPFDDVAQLSCSDNGFVSIPSNVSECFFDYCPDDLCTDFTSAVCEAIPDDDVVFLPQCPLQRSLQGVFGCVGLFVEDYPYYDKLQCRSNIDATLVCLVEFVNSCFGEDCPSILDLIPIPNAKGFVKSILSQARRVESLDDILTMIPGGEDIAEAVNAAVCPTPGFGPPDFLDFFFGNISSFNDSNPICEDGVLRDVVGWSMTLLGAYYESKTHREFCSAFDQFKLDTTTAWEQRCDADVLSGIFQQILPVQLQYLIPKMITALQIVENFIDNLEIPDCVIAINDTDEFTCEVGERTFDESRSVYESNNIVEAACQPGQVCAALRYDQLQTYVERGFCLSPPLQDISCSNVSISSEELEENIEDCVVDYCAGDRCIDFTPATCKALPPDSDVIPLLPGCSLRVTLNRTLRCVGPFLGDFPFAQRRTCRNAVDDAVTCLYDVFSDCLKDDCPSVLVDLVPGLKQYLRFSRINNLDDLLSQVRAPGRVRQFYQGLFCPPPGRTDNFIIFGLQALIGQLYSIPFLNQSCLPDNEILFSFGAQFNSHERLCTIQDDFKYLLRNFVERSCLGSIQDHIFYLFRGQLSPLQRSYITAGLNVLVERISNFQILKCITGICDQRPCGDSGICQGSVEAPFYKCQCFPSYAPPNCTSQRLPAPSLLFRTHRSIHCAIDRSFLYRQYEVRVTSEGNTTYFTTNRFAVRLRKLKPNTIYLISARPAVDPMGNLPFSEYLNVTTKSSPVRFSVVLEGEAFTEELNDPTSKAFKRLADEYRNNFLGLAGLRTNFTTLIIRAFVRGSVVASYEGTTSSNDDDVISSELQSAVQGSSSFSGLQIVTQLPDPPNVTITDVRFDSVSGELSEVDDAISYLVTISCDSGNDAQYSGADVTFTFNNLTSSDVCVISAQSEVQINDTRIAFTDDGPSVEFATAPIVNATVTPVSINEAWITIGAVPRALGYNVTFKQRNGSNLAATYSVLLTSMDEDDQQIRYLFRGLEADIQYGVTVAIEASPTNGIRLITRTVVQYFLTDEDECTNSPAVCDDRVSTCVNTFQSYICNCSEGYTWNGTSCTDMNECASDPCNSAATCVNTMGGYTCTCNAGYTGNGSHCKDIDECASDPCDSNATCVNTLGSYTCRCNAGYTGDGYSCADIDECASDPCDSAATCDNTMGNYTCRCNAGYTGDGYSCEGICDQRPCGSSGICQGSVEAPFYECQCFPSYAPPNCTFQRLPAPSLLFRTHRSIHCAIDRSFLYRQYEVRVTSEGITTNFTTNRFAVRLRKLKPNTIYLISARPAVDPMGNLPFSEYLNVTTKSSPVRFSVVLEGEAFTEELNDPTSKAFKRLADEYRNNFLGLAGLTTNFTTLIIRAFVRGSVVASYEGTTSSNDDDVISSELQSAVQGSSSFSGLQIVTQLPDPPNVTITDVRFDSVSGELSEVDDAISYLVTISCDSGNDAQYSGADVTFTFNNLTSSDVCVISAQAEVQINDTRIAFTDDGPSVEFATAPIVNATVTPVSINEAWITIGAVPRALGYNVTFKQRNGSNLAATYSVLLTSMDEDDQQIRYLFRGLEADIQYGVTVEIEASPTNGIQLITRTVVQYFLTDEDECTNSPAVCDDRVSTCVNTFQSYICNCSEGYTRNGTSCTDMNECASDPCNSAATCVNTMGSYTCTCNAGYTGNGSHCKDIDECASGPCDSNATCVNTLGSYTCRCNAGYTGDGYSCEDIDECASDPCDSAATCDNTMGNYTCRCNAGYTGNGYSCEDINECASKPCDANATCNNIMGSYTCRCNAGYTGDEYSCEDIDECPSDPCDSASTCDNTMGSYTCRCNAGYTGDEYNCADIDECASDPCDANATCNNIMGSYTCRCNAGYTGDGYSCEDIDECSLGTHQCSGEKPRCVNTQGSHRCTCATNADGSCSGSTRTSTPSIALMVLYLLLSSFTVGLILQDNP